MKNIYYGFGQRNADLVRVILIDSLKKTKEQPVLFKAVEAMIKKEMQEASDEQYDIHERRIAEFFTSFIPNCAFILFADAWTRYFEIERSTFDKIYMKVYQEAHGAYHKNHEP